MTHLTNHKGKHHLSKGVLAFVCSMALMACSSDNTEPYPNLLTEFADIHTDAQGMFIDFTTDNGNTYQVLNTNIKPHQADTTYRAIVGFVSERDDQPLSAHIYTLTGAMVLSDSTSCLLHHPTNIESMWKRGQYINMQLTAKGQSGIQHWGYAIDSVQTIGQKAHHHLSIHHNQAHDPLAYSQTYYASILPSSITNYLDGDTITVAVHTFDGIKKWQFCK